MRSNERTTCPRPREVRGIDLGNDHESLMTVSTNFLTFSQSRAPELLLSCPTFPRAAPWLRSTGANIDLGGNYLAVPGSGTQPGNADEVPLSCPL